MPQQEPVSSSLTELQVGSRTSVEGWEAALQRFMVQKAVCRGDRVLEVGYGLGMASAAIRSSAPREHWIIEPYAGVFGLSLTDVLDHVSGILMSRWQELIPLWRDETIDSIIYDADPEHCDSFTGSVEDTFIFARDFVVAAQKILTKNGRIAFIDFSAELQTFKPFLGLLEQNGLRCACHAHFIEPPLGCAYAKTGNSQIVLVSRL
ncbi:hypothetical protein P9281_27515 [Caballeronia sp. LP003]|uniref:hypothetical protein n=1 Tax=Caballeronia sp. LP003 TaxID=3038551 RepID=UPI002858B74A|nr:hypothetical protein [Caballeronia sp. LP003]MDR5790299.1 hypothetical protein [Caballeronia sp. LP003]